MKLRVLLVGLLLCAAPRLAQAQTFVQACSSGDSGSSTCAATAFSTLTAGALVVLTVRVPNTTDTVTGFTGCGSGWARAFSRVSSNERNETWYAFNLGAISCAPVPTWSGVDPGARMSGAEFSGVSTTTPLDVTASATNTSTSFNSGATATLAQATNLAVGTCANNDYQTNWTMTTYTRAYPPSAADVNRILIAYRITTTTAAETFTATGDNSTIWSCGVAVFKAAGGGGGGSTPRLTLLGVGN